MNLLIEEEKKGFLNLYYIKNLFQIFIDIIYFLSLFLFYYRLFCYL